MRRRLSLACLLVAWFCANGAVWDVVQVVAWARMFCVNAQILSVGQAVRRTFDGSKPCELCAMAQKGRDAARDQAPAQPVGQDDRLLLVCHVTTSFVPEVPASGWPAASDAVGVLRADSVPVPPPRA